MGAQNHASLRLHGKEHLFKIVHKNTKETIEPISFHCTQEYDTKYWFKEVDEKEKENQILHSLSLLFSSRFFFLIFSARHGKEWLQPTVIKTFVRNIYPHYHWPQTDSFCVLSFFHFLICHHRDQVERARVRDGGEESRRSERRNATSHSKNELYLI